MSGKNATELLKPDSAGLARAAQILRDGGLVAVPTETVYGLAARADNDAAVARIYEAKGRPGFNPLIVHVAGIEDAERIVRLEVRAKELAARFWPGPVSMVLPLAAGAELAAAVTAGLPTVAVRAPAHPVMRALLEETELPLAAPSANASEGISPTSADHVLATLDGKIDAVIDAGSCERGLESSIVALRDSGGWEMLRPGPIGEDEISALLGPSSREGKGIEAPGQLARHYSPGKPVRLDASSAEGDEFHIGFGGILGDVSLSSTGDLRESAANLYACLHQAAASPKPRVAIAPIPDEGIGQAINDRLRRAAA